MSDLKKKPLFLRPRDWPKDLVDPTVNYKSKSDLTYFTVNDIVVPEQSAASSKGRKGSATSGIKPTSERH